MTGDAEAPEPSAPDQPVRRVSLNQIVAWNMARWRKAAGMTQAELGDRLGWSFRAVSAAERTWDRTDGKGRVFDAPLLVALARVLGVPAIALLLPPETDEEPERYLFSAPEDDLASLSMADLFALLMPESASDTPVMGAYREARTAATRRYLERPRADDLITALDAMAGTEHSQELLRQRVEALRDFEREYRRRLQAWVDEASGLLARGGD